jgi:GAF domain-containing protein
LEIAVLGFPEEQAAVRRVATLVAGGAPPEEVFAAVTAEAGRLLGAQHSRMSRYDPDGAARVVATWSGTGAAHPVGIRTPLGGRNLYTLVFETGRAARIDDYAAACLVGLKDRVEALGGRIALHSPPRAGTTLHAELPLCAAAGGTSR